MLDDNILLKKLKKRGKNIKNIGKFAELSELLSRQSLLKQIPPTTKFHRDFCRSY